MIRLDDPYAFRGTGAQPIQAVVVPEGDTPELPGADVESFAVAMGLPGASSLEGEEDLVKSLIDGARDQCERYSGYVPIERMYRFRYDVYPFLGAYASAGIHNYNALSPWFDLPRRPLIKVESVKFGGEEFDFDTDKLSNPPRVRIPVNYAVSRGFADIEIKAKMGPEQGDRTFATAVTYLAVFLYDNWGCDGGDALEKSGAKRLLRPYKVAGGHLL